MLSFSGCNNKTKTIEINRIDTLYQCDTAYIQLPPEIITINKPVPIYITEVKRDTVRESTVLITENKIYNDTICKDNDSIIIQNSITGVNPILDYCKVDWRKQDKVITNTITIEKVVKNNKRISIGLQGGYGYGLINKQPDAFIGVGISYRLF